MKQIQIDQFFKLLDAKLGLKGEVILLGASAGSLMGHIRPSLDIDFEIRLKTRVVSARTRLVEAIEEVRQIVGVSVNYSENVAGWSLVSYLDYRKTALAYKTFGKLAVKLIAPEYWTIGKMARFLEFDVQDMSAIIKKKKIPATRLIRLWARAVKTSDLSLELGQFKEHVLYFLNKHARKLWGGKVNPEKLILEFKKQIGES